MNALRASSGDWYFPACLAPGQKCRTGITPLDVHKAPIVEGVLAEYFLEELVRLQQPMCVLSVFPWGLPPPRLPTAFVPSRGIFFATFIGEIGSGIRGRDTAGGGAAASVHPSLYGPDGIAAPLRAANVDSDSYDHNGDIQDCFGKNLGCSLFLLQVGRQVSRLAADVEFQYTLKTTALH